MKLEELKAAARTVLQNKMGGLYERGVQECLVMDDERGHYQWLGVGWTESDSRRAFDVYVHLDVREGMIWVQVDNTEPGIADELVELGIPKNKIVLGFQAPYKRKFTEFATGDAA
jgi:XisI protein